MIPGVQWDDSQTINYGRFRLHSDLLTRIQQLIQLIE